MNSFAGRDDFQAAQVRRTQEISPVRQHWESRVESVSPGTGRKNPLARIFRPVPGLVNWQLGPTAVRRGLVSFALRALEPTTLFVACRNVGQTPWSARVPLDPLSSCRTKSLDNCDRPTRRRPQSRGDCPTINAGIRLCESALDNSDGRPVPVVLNHASKAVVAIRNKDSKGRTLGPRAS